MAVDSYLELFTTLFGWQFYNILWGALSDTGLVYLPFLGILIDNWREPATSGGFEDGTRSGVSLRRMEMEVFLAMLVVVLAAQPAALTPINAGSLQYTPVTTVPGTAPTTATVASPQSTYGASGFGGVPDSVDVPPWWYATMALSAGLNQAVITGFPSGADIRVFEQRARIARIQDARVRQETNDFYTYCFVPARSKFLRERPETTAVSDLVSTYGQDDPEWIGSHIYRDLPGYYDELRPTQPVPGWAYDSVRDTEYDSENLPAWGRPTCKQWWEDGTSGLRSKLIDQGNLTSGGLSGVLVAIAPGLASEKQNDAVARAVISNSPPVWSNNDFVQGNSAADGVVGTVLDTAKGASAAAGVIVASGLFSVTMTVVLTALPMVQAVLLLGIYSLLPMIVLISRYSISMMVVGALGIFTVKFWTVLWYLAQWIDQNLITSMYPDVDLLAKILSSTGEHDTKRLLLNMITTSLYIGLPLLWSGMMVWSGRRIALGLNMATNRLSGPAETAGQQGGSIAGRAVGMTGKSRSRNG